VLKLLRDSDVVAEEQRFSRDEAYLADETFMTGTAAEVTPVREIDGRQIGEGRPGPVTQALQRQYAAVIRGQDDRYSHWLTPVG
jgi:branched-chain amino acid aminotransferase